MKLYASLVNSLTGIYYPLPTEDEHTARLMMIHSPLAKLWCSIYSEAELDECIERWGGIKLPDRFAARLDYDHHEVIAKGGVPMPAEARILGD